MGCKAEKAVPKRGLKGGRKRRQSFDDEDDGPPQKKMRAGAAQGDVYRAPAGLPAGIPAGAQVVSYAPNPFQPPGYPQPQQMIYMTGPTGQPQYYAAPPQPQIVYVEVPAQGRQMQIRGKTQTKFAQRQAEKGGKGQGKNGKANGGKATGKGVAGKGGKKVNGKTNSPPGPLPKGLVKGKKLKKGAVAQAGKKNGKSDNKPQMTTSQALDSELDAYMKDTKGSNRRVKKQKEPRAPKPGYKRPDGMAPEAVVRVDLSEAAGKRSLQGLRQMATRADVPRKAEPERGAAAKKEAPPWELLGKK